MNAYEQAIEDFVDEAIIDLAQMGLPPMEYYIWRGVLRVFPELKPEQVEDRIEEIRTIVRERLAIYRLIESAYAAVSQ